MENAFPLNFPTFPRKHFDEMCAAAKKHDPNNLPDPTTLRWRFDHAVGGRMDASESAYISRQLEWMRQGVLEVKYPALKGAIVVPIDTSVDPGAASYTYQVYDHVGSALVCADLSTVPPRVDISGSESTQQIRSVICAFGYSIQEARAAAFAKAPLIPRRAMAARDITERTLDDIWFNGHTVMGLKGLLNLAGTTTFTAGNAAAGGTLWDSKTPEEILFDLNGAVNLIVTNTKEIYAPDTVLLPLSLYTLISSRRIGLGDSTTILAHFLKVSPYITNVFATHKSETAGAGSTRRVVTYRRDPNVLTGILPQPFEMLPPQSENYEVVTPCHARTGGVILFQPKAVCFTDGV